jgi:hypothetical protein
MKNVIAIVCSAVVVVLAAGGARADYMQTVAFRTDDPTHAPFSSASPTATSNGVFWIDTGSGPTALRQDVNLQLLGSPTASNLQPLPSVHVAGKYSTLLLSDGTANKDLSVTGNSGQTNFYGVMYDFSESAITVPAQYYVPGAPQQAGASAYFQVLAWSGSYNTYADAYVASARGTGVYVANSGVFSNPLGWLGDTPPDLPPNLTNMPAVVLRVGLDGDANIDGRVDINDLTKVLSNYNQSVAGGVAGWMLGDFNGDDKVDINDLTIVLANYNTTVGAPAPGLSAVPEPSVLALAAAALISLLVYAWRKPK